MCVIKTRVSVNISYVKTLYFILKIKNYIIPFTWMFTWFKRIYFKGRSLMSETLSIIMDDQNDPPSSKPNYLFSPHQSHYYSQGFTNISHYPLIIFLCYLPTMNSFHTWPDYGLFITINHTICCSSYCKIMLLSASVS